MKGGIDATDRGKISRDQKRFFIALSLYPLSFFANTPFKMDTNLHVFKMDTNLNVFKMDTNLHVFKMDTNLHVFPGCSVLINWFSKNAEDEVDMFSCLIFYFAQP